MPEMFKIADMEDREERVRLYEARNLVCSLLGRHEECEDWHPEGYVIPVCSRIDEHCPHQADFHTLLVLRRGRMEEMY